MRNEDIRDTIDVLAQYLPKNLTPQSLSVTVRILQLQDSCTHQWCNGQPALARGFCRFCGKAMETWNKESEIRPWE